MKKRNYTRMEMDVMVQSFESCICNASVLESTAVATQGQSAGDSIDMSSEEFNHVWN